MKRRLKWWVKPIIAIVLLIIIDVNYVNNSVRQCVNAGHSQEYCEKGLR